MNALRLIAAILAVILFAMPALAGEQVAVVTRVIYPGQEIAPDAVRIAKLKRRLASDATVARVQEDLVGQIARRTILPDRIIDMSAVREANLVDIGKPVRVSYRAGALSITMTAMSLTAGAAGDVIKLRNSSSGKVFAGVVMDDGTVQVGEAP